MKLRHELKYMVNEAQLELIRYRIEHLLSKDSNQTDDYYTITSLYYDDFQNRCLNENYEGKDIRSKYRIRIYNHCADKIKLEKKSKIYGMTKKEVASISMEECTMLMRGKIPGIREEDEEIKKKIFCEMKIRGLQPKSIVEYNRTAYVQRVGNVRITFDKNITGSNKIGDFFEIERRNVPLLPSGLHILEVKYDELLPNYLKQMLEIETLQRTAFSKYCYARIREEEYI